MRVLRPLIFIGVLLNSATVAAQMCQSPDSDADGDGWGWENNRSCMVVTQCSASATDPDGDGWGWENGRSCRVPVSSSVPVCSGSVTDFDGDGWGWESGKSCLIRRPITAAAVAPVVIPQSIPAAAESLQSGTKPVGVSFNTSTLRRIGGSGDNWCQTWAADGSVITAMDDGEWFNRGYVYHSRLYKIFGEANSFTRAEVRDYPEFHTDGDGWFAYGMLSVNGVIYSLVTKTQHSAWSEGPFRGMKMLRSHDSGTTWHRVDRNNKDRYLGRYDKARELLNKEETFFFEESGRAGKGKTAYPFSFASFVQSGQDHRASKDGYVYIYSPEGSASNQLLLARVPEDLVGQRSAWQYFSGWSGDSATWTSNIEARQPNMVLPDRNSRGEHFGFYSWLPSVVWNPGLQLYVMVNGGTYGGDMSGSRDAYYNKWMHNKSGSLGLWYSENPYGPWNQFYYNDHWTADDSQNLTYQPKLSPKWISDDGRKMTLIWSDAMRNAEGFSHSINYKWNQMEIEIQTD